MISEELRERIRQFALGGPLRPTATVAPHPIDIECLIPGEIVPDEAGGQFYRIRRSVTQLHARDLFRLARDHLPPHDGRPNCIHPDLYELSRAFPTRTVFLDVETCGFSGAPLFLVGLLRDIDGVLFVEQLLARDYTEERAVLRHLWQIAKAYDVLVTFNGKSFDWPFIMDRSVAHRIARAGGASMDFIDSTTWVPSTHCDLLHLARRIWKEKHELPDCRLQTLETVLCGRRRHGDIPGYLVGECYHRYVRSRDARHMEQVLHHNAVDLLTLTQLALLMVRELDSLHLVETHLAAGPELFPD